MSRASRPILRAPLRELIDDRLPEAQVQRMWRNLQDVNQPRERRRVWVPLMAAATVALSVAAGAALYLKQRPAALAIQGAGELSRSHLLGGATAASYRLTDGSQIQFAPSSRATVLANDSGTFAMRLESGRARFDVTPGGPRRWSVDCGELRVEVVGTSFSVDRDPDGVGVKVEHGIVLVRGARVPNGAQRLHAGQALYVARTPVAVPAAAPSPAPRADTPALREEPVAQKKLVVDESAKPRPQIKVAELQALLRAADRARRADHPTEARTLLEQVRTTAPESPHAALAALTLARMRIASEPRLAAADLDAALAGKLPAALREDAMARLVEAHARAGARVRARVAAAAYARAFPRGRWIEEVTRWVAAP